MVKESTKKCPICDNVNLVLFRGSNQKACNLHDPIYYFDWTLDEGQKSTYANNRDKTTGEVKL